MLTANEGVVRNKGVVRNEGVVKNRCSRLVLALDNGGVLEEIQKLLAWQNEVF